MQVKRVSDVEPPLDVRPVGSPVTAILPANRRMNDFAGTLAGEHPELQLAQMGVEPIWFDNRVAFGGAPVWHHEASDIVLSGELFLDNAQGLRELLSLPRASDAELILELIHGYGISGLSRLIGMFGMAVWDRRNQQLVLWRDGTGARTLFYTHQQGSAWFASRLYNVRRAAVVSSDINPLSIRRYLTFSYIPGADTMWSDVSELQPGEILALPEGASNLSWFPKEQIDPGVSMQHHAQQLRGLLETVIDEMLPSSQPPAVLLSGGIDSSLVVALASRMTNEKIPTFSVHFGAEYPNELEFSQLVADQYRTEHHVIEITPPMIAQNLEATMAALDNPIGDPLTVPNYLMGQFARKHSQYVFNGEGGDQCFGGPKNAPMLLSEYYSSSVSRETNYLCAYRKCYDELPLLLSARVQAELRTRQTDESLVGKYLRDATFTSYVNRLMLANVRMKGSDHIMAKVNNLTVANGLIGRSPLFDQRVIAYSFCIPPRFKVSGSEEKLVLKEAVAELLPEIIIKRPKSGMRVPIQSMFLNGLQHYARKVLRDPKARIRPYLAQNTVKDWLGRYGTIPSRHGANLWQILSLEVWLRVHE